VHLLTYEREAHRTRGTGAQFRYLSASWPNARAGRSVFSEYAARPRRTLLSLVGVASPQVRAMLSRDLISRRRRESAPDDDATTMPCRRRQWEPDGVPRYPRKRRLVVHLARETPRLSAASLQIRERIHGERVAGLGTVGICTCCSTPPATTDLRPTPIARSQTRTRTRPAR
jgi:hypothetical protein